MPGSSLADRLRRAAADLFFPPTCAGCGERGVWICEACWHDVPTLSALPGLCARCGVPVVPGRWCGCRSLHPRIRTARSVFPYAGWVSAAVRGAKYEQELDRARFLGAVLGASEAGELLRRADVVVPVPMHVRRERRRGYNQAAEIATQACLQLGVAPPLRLLHQHDERESQVGLSARQRRMNVRGAFSVDSDVPVDHGSSVVLVDDVRTTGATLTACADALRPVRPRSIDVVTVAVELSNELLEELGVRN